MWFATASRRPSRSARASRPATSASTASSSRPPADSTRTTCCASSPSRSIRSASAAARLGGTAPRPSSPRGQELLREERIALAARVQAVDERGLGRRAEDAGELLAQLVAGQPAQVDPQRPDALELRQQRAQRVAPVQLVGPVGGDEQDRLVAERGGQEAQEGARRRVGPVQVLDHEQHRRVARQPVEHGEQRLEDASLVAAAAHPLASLAEPRQQRRQLRADVVGQLDQHGIRLADQRAQRRDERRVAPARPRPTRRTRR